MVATTCDRKHKPPYYTTQEDRQTDQRWNQTQECWLTFLSEIAAQDSRDTPCPGHRCFEEYHFSSAGLESANAAHEHHYYTSDEHERRRLPQTSGAYHFDSSQPTHLQCPRINASPPPQSKPYRTTSRWRGGHNMAIRLITGRLQQRSRYCAKEQQI